MVARVMIGKLVMVARVMIGGLIMVAMVLIGGARHGCWGTVGTSHGC